jgi:hypothetical protein
MTVTSRVASQLPEGLLVRLISFAYRRFEPEIRSADRVCGRGGTMVDIGGWYGPWTRRLVRRASRVVVIEPTSLHEVLSRTLPPAVDVVGAAASDHGGEAEIWLPSPSGATRGVEVEQRIQPVENVTDLLASWGYRGWVLPGPRWVPLADFPLAAHQARTMHAAERGLARRLLWPFPRYVNSVLFLPESQAPGVS